MNDSIEPPNFDPIMPRLIVHGFTIPLVLPEAQS